MPRKDQKGAADAPRLLHLLEVHQLELGLQNAELQKTRCDLEEALEKYTDLYDLAPVGYFTLAADGTIHLANLNGASLIGVARSLLVGRSFGILISPAFRASFSVFLNKVFATKAKHSADFELFRTGEPPRLVNIVAQRLLQREECLAAVLDISPGILHAQHEERKRISRELHDEVVQNLVGINFSLEALTREAEAGTTGLVEKIKRTQWMVQQSVEVVHEFARRLRPTVLDELRPVPALEALMKEFTQRTGIPIRFGTFCSRHVKQLDNATRTTFYRVAQEALINVARHAQASQVEVRVEKLSRAICLTIKDNGKSFPAQQVMDSKKNTRLGLVGMRERLEMVGGRFTIESALGQGTTVRAHIPLARHCPNRTRRTSSAEQDLGSTANCTPAG